MERFSCVVCFVGGWEGRGRTARGRWGDQGSERRAPRVMPPGVPGLEGGWSKVGGRM